MSRLEELIQELCPNGVCYYYIEDIAKITRGRVISKQYIIENEGEYPVYSSQTENNGELGFISTYDFDGEYLTWTTDGANAGSVFYRNGKFSITNVCGLIEIVDSFVMIRFLYYILSVEAKKYVNRGMGNPKLMSNVMAKVKIPVPPLEVQREIVRILDHFTELTIELTAELTTELTARKKQYEYYRDHLLTFGDDVPLVKLGDIATIRTGRKPKHINDGKCGYEYINAGTTNSGYVDEYNCEGDTVTTPSRGQGGIGFVGYQLTPFWLGPLCYKIRAQQDNVLNKYIFYILSSYKQTIVALKKEGGTPAVNASDLGLIKIPLPSLEKQQRIVDILDRFDTLCNDLTAGLPAEIEARQKQYEYYRDKLLTFEPLAD